MIPRPEYPRLRRLIESLHRFSDSASNNLTEEIEKDLLIALSQVFRRVKQLIDDSYPDEEPSPDVEYLSNVDAGWENRHCLVDTIGDLVFLLGINSRYAQHLTGNILVAISEVLLESAGDWDAFIHSLCLSLEFAIRNILKASPVSCAFRNNYLKSQSIYNIFTGA